MNIKTLECIEEKAKKGRQILENIEKLKNKVKLLEVELEGWDIKEINFIRTFSNPFEQAYRHPERPIRIGCFDHQLSEKIKGTIIESKVNKIKELEQEFAEL